MSTDLDALREWAEYRKAHSEIARMVLDLIAEHRRLIARVQDLEFGHLGSGVAEHKP